MNRGRRGASVAIAILALVGAQVAAARSAAAGFAATASVVQGSVGTATLGPATSPSAARASCVVAVGASISVAWSTSALATGYQVRYGTTSGGPYGTTVTVPGGASASTTVGPLAFSTTYHVVVVATVGGWTSSPTAQVSVTTPSFLCL